MTRWSIKGIWGLAVFIILSVLLLFLLSYPTAFTYSIPSPTPGEKFGLPQQSVELVSNRTRDSKTYTNGPSGRISVFQPNLHYQDQFGIWKDVDLTPRDMGQGKLRSDRASVIVEQQGRDYVLTDRRTGTGIRWVLPLGWDSRLTRSGIKTEKLVSTPQGVVTYSFPYTLVGGQPLVLGTGGSLLGDGFTIPPVVVIGADKSLKVLDWVVDPRPGLLSVTLDDTGIPTPYLIDPTTNFSIAAGGNDGLTSGNNAAYASVACLTADTAATTHETARHFRVGPVDYLLQDGHLRWDTSSIPDTDTVVSATLRLRILSKSDADSRSLVADWNDFGAALTCADWVHDSLSDAITGVTIASLNTGADNTLTLSAVSNISKTTFTGIRLHVSGGQPTGLNGYEWESFDHANANEPLLAVFHVPTPDITSISPNSVRNNASASLTATGTSFDTVVMNLLKSGQPTIDCTGSGETSTAATRSCPITAVDDGLWDVRITNGGSTTDTLSASLNIYGSYGVPSLVSVSPSTVGNLGSTTLTIAGSSFDRREFHGGPNFTVGDGASPYANALNGAQVTLTKSGETTITCTGEVTIFGTHNQITTTCDFGAVATGVWSLVVTNNSGDSSTLADSVTVTNELVGDTLELTEWDTDGALFTYALTVTNSSQTEFLRDQIVGFPLSGQILVDNNYLTSTGSNGALIAQQGGEDFRPGSMPPSSPIAVEMLTVQATGSGTFTDFTTAANNSTAGDTDLLPSTGVSGDLLYVGMQHAGQRVKFNISTAGVGTWSCAWEYYNGAQWAAVSGLSDGTDCLRKSGLRFVSFTQSYDRVQTQINGTYSYWLRMRLVSVNSFTQRPIATQVWWETGLWYSIVSGPLGPSSSVAQTLALGGPAMASDANQQITIGPSGATTVDTEIFEVGSNNFKLAVTAYLDTFNGTGRNIVNKSGGLTISVPSVGVVRATYPGGVTVEVTGVAVGWHGLTLERVGSTFTLSDLTTSSTGSDYTRAFQTATSGVAVPNTTNGWEWGVSQSVTASAVRAFDKIQLTVGSTGSMKLDYRLQELPSLTLKDLKSNQNGVLGFPGPMSQNLSSSLGPFLSTSERVVPEVLEGPSGPETTGLDVVFDEDTTGANYPGFNFLQRLFMGQSGSAAGKLDGSMTQAEANTMTKLLYSWGMTALIIAGSVATFKWTRSPLVGGVVTVALIIIGSMVGSILSPWLAFPVAIVCVFIWMNQSSQVPS